MAQGPFDSQDQPGLAGAAADRNRRTVLGDGVEFARCNRTGVLRRLSRRHETVRVTTSPDFTQHAARRSRSRRTRGFRAQIAIAWLLSDGSQPFRTAASWMLSTAVSGLRASSCCVPLLIHMLEISSFLDRCTVWYNVHKFRKMLKYFNCALPPAYISWV